MLVFLPRRRVLTRFCLAVLTYVAGRCQGTSGRRLACSLLHPIGAAEMHQTPMQHLVREQPPTIRKSPIVKSDQECVAILRSSWDNPHIPQSQYHDWYAETRAKAIDCRVCELLLVLI